MPTRLTFLLACALLTACIDGGSSKDTGTPGADDSDCVPFDPQTTSWEISDSIDSANAEDQHTIAVPTSRDGVVRATLSFGAYAGSPKLWLFADSGDKFPVASVHAGDPISEDYTTTVFLEWGQSADDTVILQVDEFLSSIEAEDYPVDYTLSLTHTEVLDCWEDNDLPEQAARMPVDAAEPHAAFLLGTPQTDSTLRGGEEDWYTLAVPDGAVGLSLAITPPADVYPQLEVFSDSGTTSIGGVSASSPGEAVSVDIDAAGTVWLRVSDAYSTEGAWGEPNEDTPAPDHLTAPYALTVQSRL